VHDHLAQVKEVGGELELCFLGKGIKMDGARVDIPVMPQGRYCTMTDYTKRGRRACIDLVCVSVT